MSPFFQYEAIARTGDVEKGTIMALDIAEARAKLRRTGFSSVLNLEGVDTVKHRSVSGAALQETLTSLAILLKGGLPLLSALQAVAGRTRSPVIRSAMLSMSGAVESGQSLSDAAAATGVFPEHLLAGIRVGEESGKLSESLTRAADALARENAFRRRMEAILMYPCVVFTFSMFVIGFLLTFVVPKLTAVFEGSTQALPMVTRILLAFSRFVQAAGPSAAAVLLVLFAGGMVFIRTDGGIQWKEGMMYRFAVYRKVVLSRWLSSLSVLLESGLDLVKALDVTKSSAGGRRLGIEVEHLREGLKRGRSFSALIAERPIFDVIPTELIASGESGGQLRMVCAVSATALEEEATRQLERFAMLLEPALILGLGIFAGLIVVSILLPIADLSKAVQ